MKSKKIIPLVVLSFGILGLVSINIYSYYARANNDGLKNTSIKKINDENVEDNLEPNNQDNLEQNEYDENIEVFKNQNVTQEKKQNEENKNSNNKEIANNNNISEPKENQEENSAIVTNDNILDILGISEDDYYNKPMYSWERIDFKTMDECLAYGDNYEPYLNGEELYNCREVISYSGNLLGIMFDTEKLVS